MINKLDQLRDILFPSLTKSEEGHWIDNSVDENLDAILIDLEYSQNKIDSSVLTTLKYILNQLTEARRVLNEE